MLLIESFQKRNSTLKRKGGSSTRELQDLKFQVTNQKSKLEELASENVELQHHNRKLQEMLKGEQKVNTSTMDCIKKELEYSTQASVRKFEVDYSPILQKSRIWWRI